MNKLFVIKRVDNTLYWNNDKGWVGLIYATQFTAEERNKLDCPVAGKWVHLRDWVKGLGQWHLMENGSTTVCGMPLLGTNHKLIPIEKRKKCIHCFHIKKT